MGSGSSMMGTGFGFGLGAGMDMGFGMGFSSGRGIPFFPGVDSNESGEGAIGGTNGGKDGAIMPFQLSLVFPVRSNMKTYSSAWVKPA